MTLGIAAFTIFIIAVLCVGLAAVVQMLAARGREAVCPETNADVMVRLDGRLALRALFVDETPARVVGCSRWPQRAGCDRACERAIKA